ncbi:MAG: hypothetical protein ACYDA9_14070 [Terriglobia bacterium]
MRDNDAEWKAKCDEFRRRIRKRAEEQRRNEGFNVGPKMAAWVGAQLRWVAAIERLTPGDEEGLRRLEKNFERTVGV